MTRREFQELLLKATADVIALAREYVWSNLHLCRATAESL